jgi:hypothetical protein
MSLIFFPSSFSSPFSSRNNRLLKFPEAISFEKAVISSIDLEIFRAKKRLIKTTMRTLIKKARNILIVGESVLIIYAR